MKEDVHVQPKGEKWTVSGSAQQFETQEEAEELGRQMAKEKQCEFILHGEDGQIRQRDSYGNDPRDIPG
jgi:hypothetical protein